MSFSFSSSFFFFVLESVLSAFFSGFQGFGVSPSPPTTPSRLIAEEETVTCSSTIPRATPPRPPPPAFFSAAAEVRLAPLEADPRVDDALGHGLAVPVVEDEAVDERCREDWACHGLVVFHEGVVWLWEAAYPEAAARREPGVEIAFDGSFLTGMGRMPVSLSPPDTAATATAIPPTPILPSHRRSPPTPPSFFRHRPGVRPPPPPPVPLFSSAIRERGGGGNVREVVVAADAKSTGGVMPSEELLPVVCFFFPLGRECKGRGTLVSWESVSFSSFFVLVVVSSSNETERRDPLMVVVAAGSPAASFGSRFSPLPSASARSSPSSVLRHPNRSGGRDSK